MEVKQLTCIGCPVGCSLTVEINGDTVEKVTGNNCNIGKNYAEKECTSPTRIVTSSVLIEGGATRILPVKTERDIPKTNIFQCVKELKGIKVKAPINIGDVIIKNVANTGVDVVASKSVKEK